MTGSPDPKATKAETEKQTANGWFARKRARPGSGEAVKAEPAPPPPKKKQRRGGVFAMFSGMLTAAVLVLALAFGIVATSNREFNVPGPLLADKVVIIERGASTEDIVETLAREGVITRSGLMWIALLWRDISSKIMPTEGGSQRAKAGEYLFKQAATMSEVIETITSGRSIQHTITIPEGLTSEQIVQRLKENELLTGEVATIPAEGSLLPDTYRINRGTSRESLLARMAAEQRRVLNDIWNRRAKDLPVRNPRELVTLASIVEKETGRADERPRVASVFYNRIEKKMRLQSDPTIVYGIVGGKGTLGRPISRADIDRPTAYNTYTIPALPPGPIANPGRAAMEATANPSRTKDIFFVADGTGGHAFAETLEQHNRNVARWRQIEARQRESVPATGLQPVPSAPPANSGPAPAGSDRSEAPGTLAPATNAQGLGFVAPPRQTDRLAPLAPPPQQETVGSIPASPARPERPLPAGRDALLDRNYDLSTPKVIPRLN
ncbi:COG1559 Aminodeoxychorismate lyase [Rhabdaerophilaceae bacterium]